MRNLEDGNLLLTFFSESTELQKDSCQTLFTGVENMRAQILFKGQRPGKELCHQYLTESRVAAPFALHDISFNPDDNGWLERCCGRPPEGAWL